MAGNRKWETLRRVFGLLGLDDVNANSVRWNPLGGIVRPGDTVVLKPNLVREFRDTQPGHGDCLMTHGSVIREVVEYVYIALQGRGRIIVADAPHNDADFAAIRRITGLDEIREFYREQAGFDVEVYDLRPERARKIDGVIVGHEPLPGDPAGYVKVDLGPLSMFAEADHLCHLLYGSEYDRREIVSHHTGGRHEYLISRTVLDADVVISLPKLKTHKKVGLTVNLKNMVGINGNKNWLPHYRIGRPSQGGDEFADEARIHSVERMITAGFKRVFPLLGPLRPAVAGPIKALGKQLFGDTNGQTVRSGNWHGNDTAWRMCIDLNRILLYADSGGMLHDRPVRRFFSVVDGIVGGEGNGPLDPTPKPVGLVLAGGNPVAVDFACARLMGFEEKDLPLIDRAFNEHPLPLAAFKPDDVTVASDDPAITGPVTKLGIKHRSFEPHFGWKLHAGGPARGGATVC